MLLLLLYPFRWVRGGGVSGIVSQLVTARLLRPLSLPSPHLHTQASEDMLVHLLEDCNLCAIHAKRVTISECTGSKGVAVARQQAGNGSSAGWRALATCGGACILVVNAARSGVDGGIGLYRASNDKH